MSASTFTKIVATAVIAGMFVPVAFAERSQSEARDKSDSTTTVEQERGGRQEQSEEQEYATSSARRDDEDNATTTGEQEREEHRSEVAKQVQKLLDVADRDEDIGDDVREVAHEVASSSERADEDVAKVDERPRWLVFLIGADFKDLGALRSDVATTQNSIDRLTKARDRATSSTTQATLDAQINALKDSASSTETYVRAHENVFSVFGWFFKLFSR